MNELQGDGVNLAVTRGRNLGTEFVDSFPGNTVSKDHLVRPPVRGARTDNPCRCAIPTRKRGATDDGHCAVCGGVRPS
jgi:hypothetical protein